MASNSKKEMWDELNLSNDEVKRLGDAFKDEKFRKLFVDYAEEISNPENRRLYEDDIRRMENERGSDVEFIHPEPGHVIKTNVDGEMKAFINISKNDKIDKPVSRRETNPLGQSGLHWSIPHSFAPPREDLDNDKKKCKVFDVVFHSDTYRMGESNKKFLKMIEDTAMDGIEQRFEVKLDRQNIKRPKMAFKGTPMPTVMRSKLPGVPPKIPDEDDPLKDLPYPYDKDESSVENSKKSANSRTTKTEKLALAFVEPKYTITHRTDMDLQEYRNAPDARTSTRPKELVINIELPLLSAAAQGNLDIFEDRLVFESKHPAAYKLDMKLFYPVDDEHGAAKFDKSKRCLIVTLPVLKAEVPEMPFIVKLKEMDSQNVDSTENGNEGNPEKPLIEVLSKTNQENGSSSVNESELDDATVYSVEPLNDSPMKNKMVMRFPGFTYNQDHETVTYIFPVTNVSADSVSKTFHSINSCWMKFVSLGSGGFPISYSFLVTFPPTCLLVPEECSIDVSSRNVVLLLLKNHDCQFLWERFTAGVDQTSQEEHLFVTETNLQHELDELQTEAENHNTFNTISEPLSVEVSEMNRKKLTINVKKSVSKEEGLEDEVDDEIPSSADIEVVHKKVVPNLHSILKQRSISESSDDICSPSSSSPLSISPENDFAERKSVSFSERIDKTSYKQNALVTSMKTALKSKRRRARKRDERHGCQRHNSYGSDSGSGAEELEQKSVSDSKCLESLSENKSVFAKLAGVDSHVTEINAEAITENCSPILFENNSVAGVDRDATDRQSSQSGKDNKVCDTVDTVVWDVKERGDFSNEKSKEKMENLDVENGEMTSIGVGDLESHIEITEKLKSCDVKNGEVTGIFDVDNQDVDSDDLTPMAEPIAIESKDFDLVDNIVSQASSEKTDADLILSKEFLDEKTSVVDDGYVSCSPAKLNAEKTTLSKDKLGEKGKEAENMNSEVESDMSQCREASNEHKTQCAFSFTNSVIFELDID